MELKDVGEFGLIDLIKADTIQDANSVVVGIGDDAAVVLPSPKQLQVLTTDMLVEGIHFDLSLSLPWQLGHKAMAVNLSDIAAMGGVPRHALVSLALPQRLTTDFVVDLYQGMKEICREFRVNIVGGDTVASPDGLVINVTVLGEVEPRNLVRRSGARVGDWVAVTGTLGNAAAGLDLLQMEDWEEEPFAWPLVKAHLTPRPQVAAGKHVASAGATSMNDISDGLASELNEIAVASNVGIRIYADRLPVSSELDIAVYKLDKLPLEYVLYGGEDYELVFTIREPNFNLVSQAALSNFGVKLTRIGEVVGDATGVTLVHSDERTEKISPRGYNHFR
ncbi:MAG TPA: thiamine-phosphate kinase [Patescibacteria group bacterium]|nr:thiamine-phosphate kinase [Patescibacteria group bacterium]